MKKIILVRHGKAEDPAAGITDFERSLTLRGKVVSGLMARELIDLDKEDTRLISSPAFRAIETAIIFSKELGMSPDDIIINSRIYNRISIKNLQSVISAAGEKNTVILFGHNPDFTELAGSLSREFCGFMPKSGIAGFSFTAASWDAVTAGSGKLLYFLKPEEVL